MTVRQLLELSDNNIGAINVTGDTIIVTENAFNVARNTINVTYMTLTAFP